MNLVKDLNDEQRVSVVNTEGPAITLAGPGSGKTRVLTYRVAYLIENKGIEPNRILAVTFTNKAAREMKERVRQLLPGLTTMPHISTFHSFCLRCLREIGSRGLSSVKKNFVVYDDDDSTRLIKKAIKELEKTEENLRPGNISARIGLAKNNLETPEMVKNSADGYWEEQFAEIYEKYQEMLERSGGLDFDDLLMKTVLTFQTFPSILSRFQNYYEYVLIDEFQDTNHSQYLLAKMLADEHKNLFVVGDEDQSIYSWRGANPDNLSTFEKDFPNHMLYKLENNYRSTGNIVTAASQMISENENRKEKTHWTENPEGEKISYYSALNDIAEATFVINNIRKLKSEYNLSNIAILYRTNWQSRIFEEQLLKEDLNYTIIGGTKFYQRKEIKDIISYFRFVLNRDDDAALERIINTPRRGIGAKTLEKVREYASGRNISMGAALYDELNEIELPVATLKKLRSFTDLIKALTEGTGKTAAPQLIKTIINKTGYQEHLLKENDVSAESRMDNLRELISGAANFHEQNPEAEIETYLDHVTLLTDLDEYNPDEKITLMTAHTAKGLEFDVVFLVGLEENILPHSRSMDDPHQLEEERRLCFVAMTRAAKRLFLTNARQRMSAEGIVNNQPSRFIDSIEARLLNKLNEFASKPIHKKSPIKGTSTLKVGSNLENIKSFFDKNHLEFNLPEQENAGSDLSNVKSGMRVEHPKFGLGVISRIEGHGKGRKAQIMFKNAGYRTVLLEYADLTLLD